MAKEYDVSSADGELDSEGFVNRMRLEEKDGGRRFEKHRFYCADNELIRARANVRLHQPMGAMRHRRHQ